MKIGRIQEFPANKEFNVLRCKTFFLNVFYILVNNPLICINCYITLFAGISIASKQAMINAFIYKAILNIQKNI